MFVCESLRTKRRSDSCERSRCEGQRVPNFVPLGVPCRPPGRGVEDIEGRGSSGRQLAKPLLSKQLSREPSKKKNGRTERGNRWIHEDNSVARRKVPRDKNTEICRFSTIDNHHQDEG
ncbi:uncharacterized protein LOC116851265 [Odontomachus brunneus]|uniref:uncharacterized protein LOC116851265 n=1 Tax=Odontomachus brunneus TaxID=486640 RepID=UPI0013F23E48|nr:uncharacterized protein LOC116851265 [Odontomachus brunneus]